MFDIEKNVTPGERGYKGKIQKAVDTFHQMQVGDSFVYDSDNRPGYLYTHAKKAGFKVKMSRVDDHNWRIWRIE